MEKLACPYCGKLLATRHWWNVRLSNISGDILKTFGPIAWLFNCWLGVWFVPAWKRIVKGPCPCKPVVSKP